MIRSMLLTSTFVQKQNALLWQAPLLGLSYALLAYLGSVLYAGVSEVAYFWPANALVVAVLCRRPRGQWSAYLFAAAGAEISVDLAFGLALSSGLGLALSNVLESAVAAYLLLRWMTPQVSLNSLRNLYRLIAVCAIAPAISACIGAAALLHSGMAQDYLSAWRKWWIGDAVGLLLLVPAFMAMPQALRISWRQVRLSQWLESLVLTVCLAVAAFAAFGVFGFASPLRSVVFPFLVWAALRFGIGAASWALVWVAAVGVWSDSSGHGTLVPAESSAEAHALWIQVFLVIASLTTLTLAAALAERSWLTRRFQRVVEATPNAIVMVDRNDRIVLANATALLMSGYAKDELLGQRGTLLVPPAALSTYVQMCETLFVGGTQGLNTSGRNAQLLRKDGTALPVDMSLNLVDSEEGPMLLAALVDISERERSAQRLRAAFEEKEVLLKEVYHRVKNNLQIVSALISLQSKHAPEAARAALARSGARIQAMARVHEQLYQSANLATLSVSAYLNTLVGHLRGQFAEPPDIRVVCDAGALGMDQAIACGLIVTELITNAARHAFVDGRPGQISVALRRAGSSLTLEVNDNGIGLPPDAELAQGNSLGWVLVQSLAKQLGGSVNVQRADGTSVQIQFNDGHDKEPTWAI